MSYIVDNQVVTINDISNTVSESIKESLGDKLQKIILYGSYARGDFNENSDIDLMVLVDINNDNELQETEKVLWKIGWDIGTEYNTMISIFLKNNRHFQEWSDAVAYYQNIIRDGVVLYEA